MKSFLLSVVILTILTGCSSTHNDVLGISQSQLQMRNYQSRTFDTSDRALVLRAVISTMQDLGFIINRADENLGTISGTSFTHASKLTVTVRTVNKKQIVVRANAQVGLKPLEEPLPYQNFFNALEQSLFLDAHEVE